jgi:hypothetical protein
VLGLEVRVQGVRARHADDPEAGPECAGRAPFFDADHTCNRCGRSQYIIERFNADGTHTHRCACGFSWRH